MKTIDDKLFTYNRIEKITSSILFKDRSAKYLEEVQGICVNKDNAFYFPELYKFKPNNEVLPPPDTAEFRCIDEATIDPMSFMGVFDTSINYQIYTVVTYEDPGTGVTKYYEKITPAAENNNQTFYDKENDNIWDTTYRGVDRSNDKYVKALETAIDNGEDVMVDEEMLGYTSTPVEPLLLGVKITPDGYESCRKGYGFFEDEGYNSILSNAEDIDYSLINGAWDNKGNVFTDILSNRDNPKHYGFKYDKIYAADISHLTLKPEDLKFTPGVKRSNNMVMIKYTDREGNKLHKALHSINDDGCDSTICYHKDVISVFTSDDNNILYLVVDDEEFKNSLLEGAESFELGFLMFNPRITTVYDCTPVSVDGEVVLDFPGDLTPEAVCVSRGPLKSGNGILFDATRSEVVLSTTDDLFPGNRLVYVNIDESYNRLPMSILSYNTAAVYNPYTGVTTPSELKGEVTPSGNVQYESIEWNIFKGVKEYLADSIINDNPTFFLNKTFNVPISANKYNQLACKSIYADGVLIGCSCDWSGTNDPIINTGDHGLNTKTINEVPIIYMWAMYDY